MLGTWLPALRMGAGRGKDTGCLSPTGEGYLGGAQNVHLGRGAGERWSSKVCMGW